MVERMGECYTRSTRDTNVKKIDSRSNLIRESTGRDCKVCHSGIDKIYKDGIVVWAEYYTCSVDCRREWRHRDELPENFGLSAKDENGVPFFRKIKDPITQRMKENGFLYGKVPWKKRPECWDMASVERFQDITEEEWNERHGKEDN